MFDLFELLINQHTNKLAFWLITHKWLFETWFCNDTILQFKTYIYIVVVTAANSEKQWLTLDSATRVKQQ